LCSNTKVKNLLYNDDGEVCHIILGGFIMPKRKGAAQFFHEYFAEWVEVYKKGAVRPVTLGKYLIALQRIIEIAPNLKLCDLDKRAYQDIINKYAQTHERTTTMDFHHQLKGAIYDAMDEGLVKIDPTRKVVIKGKPPTKKKPKFLSQHQLQALLKQLDLGNEINWDWFILLLAKTGLRFAEALALTPNDFNFSEQKVSVGKTWDYKNPQGGFSDTKTDLSKRTIQLDWQLSIQLSHLVRHMDANQPIFIKGRPFNSTINNRLQVLCKRANVPAITLHGLRHTHASLLIFAGVSVASVAKRLGHSNITTTQETYLHIIQELESQDNEKVARHLAELC